VELEDRQRAALGRVRNLIERSVDEHARDLDLPAQLGADLGGDVQVAAARAVGGEDQSDRPRLELDRSAGVLESCDSADLDPGHAGKCSHAPAPGPDRTAPGGQLDEGQTSAGENVSQASGVPAW
jgi:hypothetical protein